MFDEVQKSIRELPRGMLPATLKTVVEQCHSKDVFNPGGMEQFVRQVLLDTDYVEPWSPIVERIQVFKKECADRGIEKPLFYMNMTQFGQLNDCIKRFKKSGNWRDANEKSGNKKPLGNELLSIEGIVGVLDDVILVFNPIRGYTDGQEKAGS